jgi:hypothetical protein
MMKHYQLNRRILKHSQRWDITLRNSVKINRRFGGTNPIHLQYRRVREARMNNSNSWLLYVGFFLRVFFDLQEEEDVFLRNIG